VYKREPDENKDKIFEPFYTKKTMGRSGTGLEKDSGDQSKTKGYPGQRFFGDESCPPSDPLTIFELCSIRNFQNATLVKE
jgi:hypothetical protein